MKNITSPNLSAPQLAMAKFVHEIRNPLTIISCEFQFLLKKYPELEQRKEVSAIHEQLTFIKHLIQEFSDYNNADRLFLKPVDICQFLIHTVDAFRPMFDYLGIQLITEIPESLPEIPVDSLRLRQVITNLLRNAEESITHNQGKIRISAKILTLDDMQNCFHQPNHSTEPILTAIFPQETDIFSWNPITVSGTNNIHDITNYLCISVSDNGCGIEPDFFPLIGTPFSTQKVNGTGLGLPIIRQIIEAHHGILKIQSYPSKGTAVSVYLPFSRMI